MIFIILCLSLFCLALLPVNKLLLLGSVNMNFLNNTKYIYIYSYLNKYIYIYRISVNGTFGSIITIAILNLPYDVSLLPCWRRSKSIVHGHQTLYMIFVQIVCTVRHSLISVTMLQCQLYMSYVYISVHGAISESGR